MRNLAAAWSQHEALSYLPPASTTGSVDDVPASAERLDQEDAGGQPAGEQRHRRALVVERGALGRDHFEIRDHAAAIAVGGERQRAFRGIAPRAAASPLPARAAAAPPDCLRLPGPRAGRCRGSRRPAPRSAACACAETARRRPPSNAVTSAVGPRLQKPLAPLIRFVSDPLSNAGRRVQQEPGEVGGVGDADVGIGGGDPALGGRDVGPPLEQLRGQPGGNDRRRGRQRRRARSRTSDAEAARPAPQSRARAGPASIRMSIACARVVSSCVSACATSACDATPPWKRFWSAPARARTR